MDHPMNPAVVFAFVLGGTLATISWWALTIYYLGRDARQAGLYWSQDYDDPKLWVRQASTMTVITDEGAPDE